MDIEKNSFNTLVIYCGKLCEIVQEAEVLSVSQEFKVLYLDNKISRMKLKKLVVEGEVDIKF